LRFDFGQAAIPPRCGRAVKPMAVRVGGASGCVQRRTRRLRFHEVRTMMIRLVIPLLLLPLLVVTLPLVYGFAWLQEAIGDRALSQNGRQSGL
jgi:hypothetical protein